MFASVNAASPVVAGDAVFVTESYTEGGALVDFAADGTAGTEIVCYEIKSGREMWRDSMDLQGARLGRASLLHIDGAFLCLGAQGTLLWLDLSSKGAKTLSKAQLFRAPETWGVPPVSRGLLYVNRNAFGPRLICYDLRGQ